MRRGLKTLEAQLDTRRDERDDEDDLWGELNDAYRHPAKDAPWFKGLVADVLIAWDAPEEVIGYLVYSFEEWDHSKALPGQVAEIMRDVVGNPFRPVTFSPEWRTTTAVALARRMYRSRDFGAMPVLADALQDAGCDSADILGHCRGPGPHVRGCWVTDLILSADR